MNYRILHAPFRRRALILFPLMCALALPAGAADKRFLPFGDSITVGHGDGIHCVPQNTGTYGGYPPRLESRLAARGIDAEMENHGKCGERTGAGVTRIDSVLDEGGDVIIIMEGTNDVSHVSKETILHNLGVMAQKAEQAGVEPLLATLVPRGPMDDDDPTNSRTISTNAGIRDLAEDNDWAFADPFDEIFPRPNWFETYYFNTLHPNADGYRRVAISMVDAAVDAATRDDPCNQVPPGPCSASSTVLCLNQGRFRVEALWMNDDGGGGVGNAVPQTDDTGAFYWVDPENIEMIVKVLDGRGENGFFWVFYGSLSGFEFSLVVTDTVTDECKEYVNPSGTFASVGDTSAFPG